MDVSTSARIKPVSAIPTGKITINGVEISRAAIAQEMQHHPADKPGDAWREAARALAIRELLLQQARELALRPEPLTDTEGRRETDEEALVRGVIDHDVITPEPNAVACRRYYEQNLRRFRSPDLREVDHILLAVAPRDPSARKTAQETAQRLITELTNAPDRFASLAKTHSACPSREVGGNLGQIGPGQTVPEFEGALANVAVGTLHHQAIESRYGVHVVRVNRFQEGKQLPFEIVHQRIANYLSANVQHNAIRQYIAILAARADIKGVDLAAPQTPLVQ